MSWVDIVLIALVVFFGTMGVLRGVQKSGLALGAFIVAFVVAFFLANTVAEAFLGLDAVRKFVMAPEGFSLFTWLSNGISGNAGVGDTFIDINFYRPIAAVIEQAATGMQAQDAMALYLSFTVFSAIIGVGLFIVVRLLLSIVTMIVKSFIPKKKSALNRLGGFFVGVVRGGAWALALTVVVSVFGGFSFIGAFEKTEAEYEKSVMGRYVNQAAYAIKNKCFLPSASMFDRIVKLSEFQVDPGDKEEPDDLSGDKLDIYCGIGNLNYEETVFTENPDTGYLVIAADKDDKLIDVTKYAASGFDVVVKAVMDYNQNAIDNLKDYLKDAEVGTLNSYKLVINHPDTTNTIYDIWTGLLPKIYNYTLEIVRSADYTSQDTIEEANRNIQSQYNEIVDDFAALKEKYDVLTLFGNLTMEMPELYVIPSID